MPFADQSISAPPIPESLVALSELAHNLSWTWDRETQQLFEALAPHEWKTTGDPRRVLASITADRWGALADDGAVIAATHEATSRLHRTLTAARWFQTRKDSPLGLVAYFSPEFGISETLPQYSGGLGVLAGDHLKAASDLGLPLVAVGLLYDEGYFRQRLNSEAMQEESYPSLDRGDLALRLTDAQVAVDLAGERVLVNVWRADVGRVPLYLLDTNVAGNSDSAVAITDRLYGGDREHRLRQEIVLGIGGVRALRALHLLPQVFHTNEGHAGFLLLERIREFVESGRDFHKAIEAARPSAVFTTHTPVSAGIDKFSIGLMEKYFTDFAAACSCSLSELLELGQNDNKTTDKASDKSNGNGDEFNMAVMGLRLTGRANGVAQLHGEVSREMFAGLWPTLPASEVPILAITNGVHGNTWVSDRIATLLRNSVGPAWDGADATAWSRVGELTDAEIWTARSAERLSFSKFVHDRVGGAPLDPDALTIGFARRFATYKRATLLLSQADRLRELLTNDDRPVQIVFAGKAHPADIEGKEMIRDIELFARTLGQGHRLVFIPDYDMAVARGMYHGCDVWLNTPRRPLEACGTSGMKAALNGALNCSILDGWWDECFDGENGWAIASESRTKDLAARDHQEATHLFELLENDIVPLFYKDDDAGLPHDWISKVRHNWRSLGPFVTAARMVRDYTTQLYEPAAGATAESTPR